MRTLKVVTCSHFFTSGPGNELEEFLRTRAEVLVSMFHPFYHSTARHTWVNCYVNGKIQRRIEIPTLPRFGVVSYLRDFIVTFLTTLRLRRRYHLFVGSNPLNASTGILLRKCGLVERVVFYKIDYIPVRFGNRLLNAFYQKVDQMCAEKSDWTWNLSKRMIDIRRSIKANGGIQMLVPIGSNFDRIQRLPIDKIQRHRLVYMGSLRKGQGIELIIEAFPEILRRIPDAELMIVGSGPLGQTLKAKVDILGMQDSVTFTGQIPDHTDVEGILSNCAIGLAPYEPIEDGFTKYTEPGKVKVYMACGLPVVITRVPEIASEIERRHAGRAIDYHIDALVGAVESLCEDAVGYEQARAAAISYAAEYSWSSIFHNAFSEMFFP